LRDPLTDTRRAGMPRKIPDTAVAEHVPLRYPRPVGQAECVKIAERTAT